MMVTLIDDRNSTYSGSAPDTQDAARILGQIQTLQRRRIAVVVSTDLNFGLGRMVQGYAVDVRLGFQVFRDIETAREWLLLGR